jgi:primosomal protein N' (replication factor Y)
MPYYHILLPQPFDHGFTYRSDIEIPIGTLVKVPFRSKYLIGINWGVEERTDISSDKIKTIADIYPLLFTQAQRDFLSRLADYNLIPLGSVIKMALAVPDALTKLDKYTPAELDLSAIQLASLTKEQDDAYKYIIERQKSGFDCLLLDGVTGSGKTEVYLNAVAEVIKENGQALVLLPENCINESINK